MLLSPYSCPTARVAASPPGIPFHFSDVDHLSVQSPHRAGQCHVDFHLLCQRKVKEETLAYPNATHTEQLRQSVCFMTSAISQRSVQIRLQRSSSSRRRLPIQRHEPVPCVQMLFRAVAQVPVRLPELSHLFSADCLFGYHFASQCGQSLLCVVSLGCAVENEERLIEQVSLMQSTQRAPCASAVGSSRNTASLGFAFSKARSTACRNSTRLSPFCRQSAIACKSQNLIPARAVDAGCRVHLSVNRIGRWSRGSPAGMSPFPEHSTLFHNVMNSNRAHPVIQCARCALW